MAVTVLKLRKVKRYNPMQKKMGYATRAIINGIETFESVAEEASRNTTLNKYELAAALGIAAEQFARALKNGYAVDLGPIGKIYPNVTSKWTETPEEQTLSLLKRGIRFDAGAEIKAAIDAAKLSWERTPEGEEVVEEEVVEGEEENPDDEEPEEQEPKFTVTFQKGEHIWMTQQYAAGERIVPPAEPEAFRWVDVPEFMPDHDITIYAQYVG